MVEVCYGRMTEILSCGEFSENREYRLVGNANPFSRKILHALRRCSLMCRARGSEICEKSQRLFSESELTISSHAAVRIAAVKGRRKCECRGGACHWKLTLPSSCCNNRSVGLSFFNAWPI